MHLYLFFHLNLMFSSIEEEQRPEVVRRCYWPILRLAQKGIPVGVEASGITLEIIEKLDPAWIAELRRLVANGKAEFIGSGYAQLIGLLVPPAVNAANQRLGLAVYQRLLGHCPRVALVNEQAFSAGLVQLYEQAGYEAIIMEWNNPAQAHPEWDPAWKFEPQRAAGTGGTSIPLIWNESIAMQKFQRYVHGEMELDEYMGYLARVDAPERWFPVYGGDAEIFDFRPGRFDTEPDMVSGDSEWARAEVLLDALRDRLVLPAASLGAVSDRVLMLGSAAQPAPVKKQGKYNLLRWAVTGRDDTGINTRCWRIFGAMSGETTPPEGSGASEPAGPADADWAELCYLWSSDFRTHITDARWGAYLERLGAMEQRWVRADGPVQTGVAASPAAQAESPAAPAAPAPHMTTATPRAPTPTRITRTGRYLDVFAAGQHFRFNCRRGLTLDAWSPDAGPSMIGTIHHGYFDEIELGADFYTGHVVLERPGRHKVTDLHHVEPEVEEGSGRILIRGSIPFGDGHVQKTWTIDAAEKTLRWACTIRPGSTGPSSLRLGHITLNPEAFDPVTLFCRVWNGGDTHEDFPIGPEGFDHGRSVSGLVTASAGTAVQRIVIGDVTRHLEIQVDPEVSACVGLLTYKPSRKGYFCRLTLSAREIDDTLRGDGPAELSASVTIRATHLA